jgi:hypothetical protein
MDKDRFINYDNETILAAAALKAQILTTKYSASNTGKISDKKRRELRKKRKKRKRK